MEIRSIKNTKKFRKNKRGQMKMSFGMMFSIFLIAVFLAAAVYFVIQMVDIGECAKIGKFIDNLQEDVNQIWNSPGDAQKTPPASEYAIPGKVDMVCFYDAGSPARGKYVDTFPEDLGFYYGKNNNMLFHPEDSGECFESSAVRIKHINATEITKNNNPYCFRVSEKDGVSKVGITMSKDSRDTLVCVGEDCK